MKRHTSYLSEDNTTKILINDQPDDPVYDDETIETPRYTKHISSACLKYHLHLHYDINSQLVDKSSGTLPFSP